jgi:nucleolar MIF4G domain-containing protein 1
MTLTHPSKPVDFTILKTQTRSFLKELFMHLFVSSQVSNPLLDLSAGGLPTTRNRRAVEEIFIKATRIEILAMGLVYFLSDLFKSDSDNEEVSILLKWGSDLAKETLRTGMDIIPVL